MKPDLHCHSHYSDGNHSPEFLFARAIENNVSHLAITDHDFITWEDSWKDNRDYPPLVLVPGVEISSDWLGKEIHIVGLNIDPKNAELNLMLTQQRILRRQRISAMNDKLESIGISGLTAFIEEKPCQSLTRSHVAEFLVNHGYCKNWEKAFKRFLGRKGRAYVPIQWCAMREVISLLRAAGGIPVLAHAGRYALSKTKLGQLVEDFKTAGGEGLEGSYGNIDPISKKHLCQLATDKQLYLSLGSDFHDARRHWTDVGKVPALESSSIKNAIWNHSRWHLG